MVDAGGAAAAMMQLNAQQGGPQQGGVDVHGTTKAAGAPGAAADGTGTASSASAANLEQAILKAREKLCTLRTALVSRALQRATDSKPGEAPWVPAELRAHPEQFPPRADPPKLQWEMQLLRLVVTLLLDRSTTLPVEVDALHRRLSQGAAAEEYQRCLAALEMPQGPHALLAQLSADQLLEALQLQLGPRAGGGPRRMWISQINRLRLANLVGVADPGATMMMLAEQQAAAAAQMQQVAIMAGNMLMMQQAAAGMARPPGMPPHLGAPLGMPSLMGGPNDMMLPPILPGLNNNGDMMGGGVGGQHPQHGMGGMGMEGLQGGGGGGGAGGGGGVKRGAEGDLDSLPSRKTMRDRMMERGEAAELQAVLIRPTAKEAAQLEAFRTADGASAIQEHCSNLTKEDCKRANNSHVACPRLHFRRIIRPHTDVSLGNCSYLNTCRNFNRCKYIHYDIDDDDELMAGPRMGPGGAMGALQGGAGAGNKAAPAVPKYLQALQDEQWIRCDIRKLDMKVLGKFGVIMADPPWQIHQDLPYGTMEDEEMRRMDIGCLQDDGVIFLWVTGRAMELGRECLKIWGYNRVDELLWIKTNQLNRLIRTGRTGHWLNHSKEHCLIGLKGKPQLNKHVDCDVVVAEVRETSRKPDEMYALLERLSPGTRKLEIFARQHNLKPGWVGLGNQLDGVKILDPDFRERYIARYGPPDKDGKLPPAPH